MINLVIKLSKLVVTALILAQQLGRKTIDKLTRTPKDKSRKLLRSSYYWCIDPPIPNTLHPASRGMHT
ncbi:hypothetical protein SPLC1_S202650 [Arthrospira platensis C1]|uniref:Uncharacterized protein n=1 Tax=Limnospira indica PCC 8005 TaxID=376219 RepID=A0A9P1P1V5_9CYAN|nr:hypothetical protein SPLC1_S202650 [Arthrospira platensis C1]CDM98208.1 conserved protein of unknown function [Limnospira indica PCC 8005]